MNTPNFTPENPHSSILLSFKELFQNPEFVRAIQKKIAEADMSFIDRRKMLQALYRIIGPISMVQRDITTRTSNALS